MQWQEGKRHNPGQRGEWGPRDLNQGFGAILRNCVYCKKRQSFKGMWLFDIPDIFCYSVK